MRHGLACSSRVGQCDAIENGCSTRLENDAFDAPRACLLIARQVDLELGVAVAAADRLNMFCQSI